MDVEAQTSTSKNVAPSLAYGKEPQIICFDDTAGPSIRKRIAITRTAQGDRVLQYRDVVDTAIKIQESPSEKRKTSDRFTRMYDSCLLGHKQRVNVSSLTNAITKRFGALRFAELSNLLDCEQSDEILRCMFIVSAYTINNYFGKPGPKSANKKELCLYLHELIPMDRKTGRSNYQIAKSIQHTKFILNLNIIEADGLKQNDNFSHVFCKVWISSKPDSIETTELAERTKHPVWNDFFHFYIKSMHKDVIHIEMWHCNDQKSIDTLENGERVRKKDLCKAFCERLVGACRWSRNNIIGKATIKISDIYSEGLEEWLPVIPDGGRAEIYLHIEAFFGVPQPTNRLDALKRHLLLFKTCLHDGLKRNEFAQVKVRCWGQILSRPALTLIFLHSMISSLSTCEDSVCRFVVLTYLGVKRDSIAFEFLHNVLSGTISCIRELEFPEKYMETALLAMYTKEAKNLHDKCLQFIGSLHSYDLGGDKKACLEFEYVLKCIYLCQEVTEINSAPLSTMLSEACNWIERKAKKLTQDIQENKAEFLVRFLDYALNYQKGADAAIKKVFPDKSYTCFTYEYFDSVLCEPMRLRISEVAQITKDRRGTSASGIIIEDGIKLFARMKDLIFYVSRTVKIPASDLKMGNFREWFGPQVIEDWFKWRKEQAEKLLTDITEDDDLITDEMVSSSLKYMTEILQHSLVELWRTVSLPRSAKCNTLFADAFHDCCMKYAYLLLANISSRNLASMFNEGGRRKMCIIANNLRETAMFSEQAISETIGKFPSDSRNTRIELKALCERLCNDLSDIVKGDLALFFENILKCQTDAQLESVFKEYTLYINKLVWQDMFSDMFFEVFQMFAKELRNSIVDLVHRYMEPFIEKNSRAKDTNEASRIFEALLNILLATEDVYNVGEDEELWEMICTDEWKKIKSDLEKRVLEE